MLKVYFVLKSAYFDNGDFFAEHVINSSTSDFGHFGFFGFKYVWRFQNFFMAFTPEEHPSKRSRYTLKSETYQF